ncbi:MAG: protein translocase subunit SecD [Polyangiales bacterium]
MKRTWYFRFVLVLAAATAAWGALWPSLDAWLPAPAWVKAWFPGRMSPGLDIKGGLRLVYEVEVDEAIRDKRDRIAEGLLEQLGVKLGTIPKDDTPSQAQLSKTRERVSIRARGERSIRVSFKNAKDAAKMSRDFLKERFPELKRSERTERVTTLQLRDQVVEDLRKDAIRQTELTISNRIDDLGVRDTTVIGRESESDVIIEVPGADEQVFDRMRAIIARTARLEFKVVDDDGASAFIGGLTDLPKDIERQQEVVSTSPSTPQVSSAYLVAKGKNARRRLQSYIDGLEVPEGHEVLVGRLDAEPAQDGSPKQELWRSYYLFSHTDVTGEDIKDANVQFSNDPIEGNQPYVGITFNATGAGRFERLTERNVKRRMAIALDDRVESAPTIQERIGGGQARITLGRGLGAQSQQTQLDEAKDLTVVLKAGALPAPIRPANEQLIGPTLGLDSVRRGAEGAVVGVGLVLLFMLLYYHVAGVVADLMVLLNLLLLLGIFAWAEVTLTLPGVAGIALTVGMAVDANVLITERIREELRVGRSPRAAVDQGFRRALWSIVDSQLTTFIAGVVLYQFGTGPIRGFAVTLMIGICTSLFTGIFCSRVFFDWIVGGLKVRRLAVG